MTIFFKKRTVVGVQLKQKVLKKLDKFQKTNVYG